jgi:hypothetical protein
MSTASTIPLWGQAWELTITYAARPTLDSSGPTASNATTSTVVSTNSWEPEALKITFEVLQSTISSPWWYADITIYNLDASEIQNIIFNATSVQLKAGFQVGPTQSAVIWDGPIFQVLYDQENVVDQRVTLHCVANPIVMQDGVVAFSLGRFASQAQLLAKAAGAINLPPVNTATTNTNGTSLSPYAAQVLSAKQYPRGNTVFGKVGGFFSQIADDQQLQTFRDSQQAYMTQFGTPGGPVPPADFIYGPPNPPNTTLALPPGTTQSIIGTPRQTPQGVIFTVLLDPRLKVQIQPHVQVVQLVRTLPSQLAQQPDPNGGYVTPLNTNLTFFVGQVRHVGDSRGNDWYTEVTGYNTTYGTNLLNGVFNASSTT